MNLKSLKARYKTVVRLCILVFIFILSMEVCARIDDKIKYDTKFWGRPTSDLLRDTDSEKIRYNVPNSRFEKWKINQFGFRGPDISLRKPVDTVRIVCMGASETFGLYESEGKEWPNQLMSLLEKHGQFDVINASVVGMGLKHWRRYLEKYVLKFDPDIVILYPNGFGYAAKEARLSDAAQAAGGNRGKDEKSRKLSFKIIARSSRIFPKMKQAIKKIIPSQLLKQYQLWNTTRKVHAIERRRLKGKKPIDVVSQESLGALRTDLEELIQFLHHQKIEVILSCYPVLINPENIDEYLEIFLEHRRFFIELSLLGMIDASCKFNHLIKTLAIKHGTGFIDINAAILKNTRYFADNVHYTDEGAKIVALSVARYIKTIFQDL